MSVSPAVLFPIRTHCKHRISCTPGSLDDNVAKAYLLGGSATLFANTHEDLSQFSEICSYVQPHWNGNCIEIIHQKDHPKNPIVQCRHKRGHRLQPGNLPLLLNTLFTYALQLCGETVQDLTLEYNSNSSIIREKPQYHSDLSRSLCIGD